jgi:hypothetical protein
MVATIAKPFIFIKRLLYKNKFNLTSKRQLDARATHCASIHAGFLKVQPRSLRGRTPNLRASPDARQGGRR